MKKYNQFPTKKILITTGGSGGHVIPSLSIYDALKDDYEKTFEMKNEKLNAEISQLKTKVAHKNKAGAKI